MRRTLPRRTTVRFTGRPSRPGRNPARGLARRLEQVPVLGDALISGSISWSTAAVLATVAGPEDADFWLAEAERRTVREMRALVLERNGANGKPANGGELLEVAEEPFRTLTLTVSREDAWCFEHARLLGRHLGERTDAELMFGLVAESTSTLCGELAPSAVTKLVPPCGSRPFCGAVTRASRDGCKVRIT